MKRCVKCLMPDTKPGLILDKEGVCQACRHHENRKNIDWRARFHALEQICHGHRGAGEYDCVVPVSGGKDSHRQVGILKDLGMNPLLVCVAAPFTNTKEGDANLANLQDRFGCDLVMLRQNINLCRKMVRIAFEQLGSPTWPIDRSIYCSPVQVAMKYGINLVFYGENVNYEYGGPQQEETMSARDQFTNDVAKSLPVCWWENRGIDFESIPMHKILSIPQDMQVLYMSYFMPWSGVENIEYAIANGFKTLAGSWERQGYIEDYDQIDNVGYLINPWLKYPKYGFARVTDVCGYWLRDGKMTLQDARGAINSFDSHLDPRILEDFLSFTGYTLTQFTEIVEKFWNPELFVKARGRWFIKDECRA